MKTPRKFGGPTDSGRPQIDGLICGRPESAAKTSVSELVGRRWEFPAAFLWRWRLAHARRVYARIAQLERMQMRLARRLREEAP